MLPASLKKVEYIETGTRKITSALPELWNTHPTARGTYCFLGCEAAENYADVPSGWK